MNGLVPAFFARIWGNEGSPVASRATAVCSSSVVGFEVTSETGNADLLPFTVKKDDWDALLAGVGADSYNYSSGTVTNGSDGVLELSMYPLSNGTGGGGVAPGNFGTVDIGTDDNSTAVLSRQIREGVNAADLAYHGGELRLGPDGTLLLNGDTGVSAAIKDDLESIKGQPRTIMLYTTVTGAGNNAMYTIVGFVGVRVMYVKLTGALASKKVVIQPAINFDSSAIVDDGAIHSSRYVYSNARLAR
jgi:hypothetical protein